MEWARRNVSVREVSMHRRVKVCSRALGLSPCICFFGSLETSLYSWKVVGSLDKNIQLGNVSN